MSTSTKDLIEWARDPNRKFSERDMNELADALERLTQPAGMVEPVAYMTPMKIWIGGTQTLPIHKVKLTPTQESRPGSEPLYSTETVARLIAERGALQEQVRMLRTVLESNQWVEYNDPDYGTQRFCPDCRNDKKVGLHHPDCDIGKALAATEPKEKAE